MSLLALIPLLEGLPGWPDAPEPSLMDIGLLTVGLPVAMFAVFAVLFMGPHWLRKSQSKEIERA
ncbi:MAG: hypothetical protein Q4F65_10085 [Propionibacteriaceae bacterium]|nr:hypothetical protein [Propionibacteriaceae bacterium]